MDYNKEKHVEMLDEAINRSGNNHNTWSIATISVLVGSFTVLGLINNKVDDILTILIIIHYLLFSYFVWSYHFVIWRWKDRLEIFGHRSLKTK